AKRAATYGGKREHSDLRVVPPFQLSLALFVIEMCRTFFRRIERLGSEVVDHVEIRTHLAKIEGELGCRFLRVGGPGWARLAVVLIGLWRAAVISMPIAIALANATTWGCCRCFIASPSRLHAVAESIVSEDPVWPVNLRQTDSCMGRFRRSQAENYAV